MKVSKANLAVDEGLFLVKNHLSSQVAHAKLFLLGLVLQLDLLILKETRMLSCQVHCSECLEQAKLMHF